MLQATVKVSLENKWLPNPNPNPIHKPNFKKLEFITSIRIYLIDYRIEIFKFKR